MQGRGQNSSAVECGERFASSDRPRGLSSPRDWGRYSDVPVMMIQTKLMKIMKGSGDCPVRLARAVCQPNSQQFVLEVASTSDCVLTSVAAPVANVKLPVKSSTTHLSNNESARINGLRVRGFSSRSTINLPPAYTKDFTPLERSHIMTPDVAKRWKHLSTVAQEIPELMDCEVRLLIGCDLLESIGTT
ncbi:hypothetical protein F2P81_016804 [Scophthalmus maximus]|uniref:Uncharacterized protein n=1 Tax=Scophthalmus maximus TaxID=52904 RepID=A0A6A4S6M7_SCOMX|nr:hypothetical protein F2P81_016804 [Scophthalmus maximus]